MTKPIEELRRVPIPKGTSFGVFPSMAAAALVATAVIGLRLPVLHTSRPFVPLDTPQLTLDEDEWNELGVRSTGRTLVGLIHTPRHERSAPVGSCGVICEVSDAGSIEDDELFVLKAVAFSRFRVRNCVDAYSPVPIFDVDPLLDAQPEDDERLLTSHNLPERRTALSAIEMRCHLLFSNVVQLLRWSGPGVASISASLAQLEPSAREELFRTVDRFAPVLTDKLTVPEADECAVPDDEETDEATAVDVCDLERTYLHACVEPSCSYTSGGDGPTGRLDARELGEFQPSRLELYSFATSRLHDYSPEDAIALVEGRSTAARLADTAKHLQTTSAWLSGMLGIDAVDTGSAKRSWMQTLRAKVSPSHEGHKRKVKAGPALQTRFRRIFRSLRDPPQAAGQPQRDGWEAMDNSVF